jgi:N-acetylglutamate synthase-like GNAT family acetyltransferase
MYIREAEFKDAPDMSKLLEQLGYPTSDFSALEKIQDYSKDGYKLFVAESERTVIGFISIHWYIPLHHPAPIGRITAFCVDERQRKSGIGTSLLERAEQQFKTVGCFKIEVTSNLKRLETHRYYLQAGYQEVSKHFVKFLTAN